MPIYPYEKVVKKNDKKKEKDPDKPVEKKTETWHYYAFEVKEADGTRKTIKKYGFKNKGDARKAEDEAKTAWNKGTYIDPSKLNFGEYITHWLEKKQDLSEQSRYTNEGHLKNHIIPFMGHIPLSKINVLIIEDFITYLQTKKLANEKTLAAGTIKKIFNLVGTALSSAVRKEMIARNPFDLLDTKPRVTKVKIDYWTKEEVQKFLGGFEHRLKLLFIMAIHTGMRRGELLGLRFEDVDFENAQIRIRQTFGFKGKIKEGAKTTAGNRSISIAPNLLAEIKKHRKMILAEKLASVKYDDTGLIFCDINGRHVSWGNFHKFWVRILEKVEVRKIRFHDLRHTCASLLLQTPGVHPKVVQELLGHSSIKVTLDIYSHLMPNMQATAVNAMEQMLL